jgi:hypothetical protein
MLVVLAGFVVTVELARNHRMLEACVLLGELAVVGFAVRWLLRDLRLHPAGFPAPSPSQGLRLHE